MNNFVITIDQRKIEVKPVVESLTSLSDDEMNHIWDRLEDGVTYGELIDENDNTTVTGSWELIPED